MNGLDLWREKEMIVENFTPVSGLIGGLLIGLAAALLLLNGRTSGISGFVGGLVTLKARTPAGA
jgi:hypothetical protein